MSYKNVAGRIYDIQEYAIHDGPGIRTTIYTKGCPLKCVWCHSPESQRYEIELGYLEVKCSGTELCEQACVNVCQENAISENEPIKMLGRDEFIRKISVDRSKCLDCIKCVQTCIPGALYTSGWDTTVDEVYDRVMKDSVFFKKSGGVTISGGEAMAQFEFTLNLAKKLKDADIHICLDTTGFAPKEHYMEILPYVDLFLYDLKEMNPERHKSFTGVSNELILQNAKMLAANNAALQIRIPVIPKLNANEKNLRASAEFCKELGSAVKLVQLLPYHATGRAKYSRLGWRYRLTNVEPPTEEYMQEQIELFNNYGLACKLH